MTSSVPLIGLRSLPLEHAARTAVAARITRGLTRDLVQLARKRPFMLFSPMPIMMRPQWLSIVGNGFTISRSRHHVVAITGGDRNLWESGAGGPLLGWQVCLSGASRRFEHRSP